MSCRLRRIVRPPNFLQICKLCFLWKLPKSCEVFIGTLPELLFGLVSTVPGRVQMVVKMSHLHLKFLSAVIPTSREIVNGLVQLLSSLAEVEEDDASIHNVLEQSSSAAVLARI